MPQLTIEQIYKSEKYDIMSTVFSDYLKNGRPKGYDERTWLDLLTVKHAINTAYKMLQEGDTVSGMTDDVPLSSYVEVEQWTYLKTYTAAELHPTNIASNPKVNTKSCFNTSLAMRTT